MPAGCHNGEPYYTSTLALDFYLCYNMQDMRYIISDELINDNFTYNVSAVSDYTVAYSDAQTTDLMSSQNTWQVLVSSKYERSTQVNISECVRNGKREIVEAIDAVSTSPSVLLAMVVALAVGGWLVIGYCYFCQPCSSKPQQEVNDNDEHQEIGIVVDLQMQETPGTTNKPMYAPSESSTTPTLDQITDEHRSQSQTTDQHQEIEIGPDSFPASFSTFRI